MKQNNQQNYNQTQIVSQNIKYSSQQKEISSTINKNQNNPQIENNKFFLALNKLQNLSQNIKEYFKSRCSNHMEIQKQTKQVVKRPLNFKETEQEQGYNLQFNSIRKSSDNILQYNLEQNNQKQMTRSSINIFQSNYENFNLQNQNLIEPSLLPKSKNDQQLLKWIRQNIIGLTTSYISPLHIPVQTVYVDHTGTNRPFKAVEILVEHAKLFAANPHTEFSEFGKFSTQLMHYTRYSLLKSFSATQNQYEVLPCGAGSTGAIQKAIHFLKILEQTDLNWKKPIVFITPYEHHSNILPWVQFYDKVQVLSHQRIDILNMDQIFKQLMNCPYKNIIVSVSATSNVTSKITHLNEMNQVIKKIRQTKQKNIIFAVDCAAFCCHHDLNLSIYDQIDFAFLSPHKNLGGAESCGILVARKSLLIANKPIFPGGGTVRFVKGYTKDDVMYEIDIFSRQIPGTPSYLGFYRAALSFQLLKNTIGYDFIHKNEIRNTKLFFDLIEAANEKFKQQQIDMFINIYGVKDLNQRANVVTFNFQYEDKKYIQHSFASLLLTDIFGIQVRSGCFCAGPYGFELLHLKEIPGLIDSIKQQVKNGILINKPGYLRLDLTFYLEKFEVQYIANAIILIGKYHKNFMEIYRICNNGQVILLPIFTESHEPQNFSFSQIESAYEKIKQQQQDNFNKLKNRKQNLQKQLRVGQIICKNPLELIKKIKINKKLQVQVQSFFSE